MRAWRLTGLGGELAFRELPDPAARAGSVRVRLEASPLLSYLRAFVDGELSTYRPPSGEFTPGTNGIGVIDRVGEDIYGLSAGQRVFCSPHLVVAENVAEPAEALMALTAEPASGHLINRWRDGTLADSVVVPASTVTPIPPQLAEVTSARLLR